MINLQYISRRGLLRAPFWVVVTALLLLVSATTVTGAHAQEGQEAADSTAGQMESAPEWLEDAMPRALKSGEIMGLQYWQWLALLFLIFLGIVADFVVRSLMRAALGRGARRVRGEVDEDIIKGAARALGLFAGALVWATLISALNFGGAVRDVALAAVGVYAVFTGTLAGWRLVDLLADVLLHMAMRTESKFDDILVPMLKKTLKVFVIALGIIYGAQHLKINIVPLIAGLGIGGLAFAFAAKDTIENFFGSIAVILDRPFEVGDWVLVDDVEGTVEELGFRSTRIRTFYNSQVTIPNATLVRAKVDNYGRRTYRRWKTTLGVQYDTPPEKLLAFTEGIRELVRRHPYTRKDFYQVWCHDFGDSSFNILVYVFHLVPDWATELRERERLFVDIVRLADRLGVQFAFPTRTLHLYKEDHRPAEPQYAVPRGSNDETAKQDGMRTARELTDDQPWQTDKPGAVEFGEFPAKPRDLGGDG
jgi:MscS family membrane protein